MKTHESGKDTNVLRKTPEEIKKGLEVCATLDGDCESCPYDDRTIHCSDRMRKDALAYIQQLETELDDEKNKNEILIFDNDKLMEEIAQAERERDVAVSDAMKNCESCKHSYMNNPDVDICPHVEYCSPRYDKWQWRGVCPENTKED